MSRDRSWVVFLVAFVIAIGLNCGLYSCTNSNCKDRGGHTEFIWGSHTYWTCVGANR